MAVHVVEPPTGIGLTAFEQFTDDIKLSLTLKGETREVLPVFIKV